MKKLTWLFVLIVGCLSALAGAAPKKLGLTAEELDAATAWGEALTRFDGRAFNLYKDGSIPTEKDFREKVLKEHKLPAEEKLKPIREGLAKGAVRCTGVWKEAFELEALTLDAAERSVRGEEVAPLPLDKAILHVRREQAPLSARRSASIIWGFYPTVAGRSVLNEIGARQ